jgi:glutamyl-tRNA synthetase
MLADISAPHGSSPVYPGFCRGGSQGWGVVEQRLPSWRLQVPAGRLQWQERYGDSGDVDGPEAVGDVVLRRADGFLAYHLATAVDELTLGISDVLRGDDLWGSTAAQVAVMAQLGAGPPRYGHVPLWRDASGHRLCKREGADGLADYRSRGFTAAAVIGALAASAGLVAQGSQLSAQDLLAERNGRDFACCIRAGF